MAANSDVFAINNSGHFKTSARTRPTLLEELNHMRLISDIDILTPTKSSILFSNVITLNSKCEVPHEFLQYMEEFPWELFRSF